MSFLMPTAVRPALGMCGTYLAVGSSHADKALSGITQVLHVESRTRVFLPSLAPAHSSVLALTQSSGRTSPAPPASQWDALESSPCFLVVSPSLS